MNEEIRPRDKLLNAVKMYWKMTCRRGARNNNSNVGKSNNRKKEHWRRGKQYAHEQGNHILHSGVAPLGRGRDDRHKQKEGSRERGMGFEYRMRMWTNYEEAEMRISATKLLMEIF